MSVSVNVAKSSSGDGGLIPGQPVVMSGGPFRGRPCRLGEICNDARLVVAMELPQRSIVLEIDRDWVALL